MHSMKRVREIKPSPIFISKFSDPSSLRQLFNQIANDEFDLKNIRCTKKLWALVFIQEIVEIII